MSNSNPKKLPHRTHNHTPKIYRWADIATEALIYFTILWGPWAFGTVHDWAITTMTTMTCVVSRYELMLEGMRSELKALLLCVAIGFVIGAAAAHCVCDTTKAVRARYLPACGPLRG